MKILAMFALAFLISACEGPMGPVGSAGAQGPQGPQGPQGLPGASAQIDWDRVRLGSDGSGVISFTNAQADQRDSRLVVLGGGGGGSVKSGRDSPAAWGHQDCANISHAIVSAYPGFEYEVSG
jgi:hypothetical protein